MNLDDVLAAGVWYSQWPPRLDFERLSKSSATYLWSSIGWSGSTPHAPFFRTTSSYSESQRLLWCMKWGVWLVIKMPTLDFSSCRRFIILLWNVTKECFASWERQLERWKKREETVEMVCHICHTYAYNIFIYLFITVHSFGLSETRTRVSKVWGLM